MWVWNLATLREENVVIVFQNKVLERTYDVKKEEEIK
jgi:hypothetical protein